MQAKRAFYVNCCSMPGHTWRLYLKHQHPAGQSSVSAHVHLCIGISNGITVMVIMHTINCGLEQQHMSAFMHALQVSTSNCAVLQSLRLRYTATVTSLPAFTARAIILGAVQSCAVCEHSINPSFKHYLGCQGALKVTRLQLKPSMHQFGSKQWK